ncbi:nuclear export factor GLE1 [Spizellomyces punctatus DAOM BR117]|uniref:Nuclear export factor GLE1 n=1 Tax=Spizellomyces punctatus (strain DAOM BR117) TaxID=645134 RepID=A0A0L0H9S2_SPIPD|nr:nuclear export factor GLE1 [Spizellomyces punctatus DAOM BR117]KNC97937.1 nuclear export factor GLE1 [Spizellomyces punctatus DAOM BR117]|eukprot:XP_016605977.1 nuclear export factor GLE1 [Spizellomyces punctatus DAOM BR117]
MFKTIATLLVLATAAVQSIHGHVTCVPPVGVPGKNVQTALRVPHGCNHTATISVTVKVPQNVTSFKPQLVPNWQLAITQRPLPQPVVSEGGTVNTTTDTVTWHGGFLPDTAYMDFGFQALLPDGPDGSVVYFETSQLCENGQTTNWNGTATPKITLMKNGTLLSSSVFGGSNSSMGPAQATKSSASALAVSAGTLVLVVGSMVGLM